MACPQQTERTLVQHNPPCVARRTRTASTCRRCEYAAACLSEFGLSTLVALGQQRSERPTSRSTFLCKYKRVEEACDEQHIVKGPGAHSGHCGRAHLQHVAARLRNEYQVSPRFGATLSTRTEPRRASHAARLLSLLRHIQRCAEPLRNSFLGHSTPGNARTRRHNRLRAK